MVDTNLHKTAAAAQIHRFTGPDFTNAAARIAAGAGYGPPEFNKAFFEASTGTYWAFMGAGLWRLLSANRPIYTDTTTARVFGMSDAEAYFRFTNGASIAGTIPPSSSVSFPIGTVIECLQAGAGQFAFVAGAGVTFGPGTLFGTSGQGKIIRARKIAADTWDITGDVASAAVASPLTIMAGHVRFGYSGDVGLTATTWQDQGPNSRNLAGTCSVAAAVLGGKAAMQTNGTSHTMAATFATPAPGTTPTYIYTILRDDAHTFATGLWSLSSSNVMACIKDSGTAEAALFDGSTFGARHAGGLTLATFKRVRALFTGTGTDSIQVGSGTLVSGAAAGNTAGTGLSLGFSNGAFAANSYAEFWGFDQDPGATLLGQLDAWASSKYSTAFP